jgi:hypothetical protein
VQKTQVRCFLKTHLVHVQVSGYDLDFDDLAGYSDKASGFIMIALSNVDWIIDKGVRCLSAGPPSGA